MLLVDALAVKFNVRVAHTTGHLLLTSTRLLGPRTSVTRLLLLNIQVSIVVSHLVLKGLLVVHEFLVLI